MQRTQSKARAYCFHATYASNPKKHASKEAMNKINAKKYITNATSAADAMGDFTFFAEPFC